MCRKIAILSDVHGNLPALEAVIADAQKQNADTFWNLGDFLGYGPYVNEVVDLLFETCSAQVIGNYDLKVLKFPEKQKKWAQSKKKEKYLALKWAWEKLSKKNADRLEQLPQQDTQVVAGLSFLLTHGGPDAVDEAIGPDTPVDRLTTLAAMTDAKAILCGHTHLPFLKTLSPTTFINPGSVGRPEGRDPGSSYAILEISTSGMKVGFQKVPYDIERLSRAIHAAGLPEDFTKMFESGANLEQVQDAKVESVDIKPPDAEQKIVQVRQFAQQCGYEQEHSEQVLKLSTILFKKLKSIHSLGAYELYLLTCAAILHDIGWMQGQTGHHKAAMRMILDDRTLPFDETERKMIALIARYHRKALPKPSHAVYGELTEKQQTQVRFLGGIMRIADGLDRSHMNVTERIEVNTSGGVIHVQCKMRGSGTPELVAAGKKADLFESVSDHPVQFIRHQSRFSRA